MNLLDKPTPWGMRYSVREVIDRAWRIHVVWWVLKVIPWRVKYYVVIQAAVKNNPGNPGNRTAVEMLETLDGSASHSSQVPRADPKGEQG